MKRTGHGRSQQPLYTDLAEVMKAAEAHDGDGVQTILDEDAFMEVN